MGINRWDFDTETDYNFYKDRQANLARLTSEYQTAYNEAKAANEKRYDEGIAINDQAIALYQPGGSYGEGAMSSYNRGKTQAKASAYSSMVKAGTANLIKGAGFDKSYEEEVGTPFRLNLQDRQTEALTSAYQNKVGFIAAREDTYPDASLYVQLMQQIGQGYGGSVKQPAASNYNIGGWPVGSVRSI